MKATLPIPQELTALIEAGFWPKDSNAAMGQNLRSLVPESVVRAFAPEESAIFFYPPPFCLVRAQMEVGGHSFWSDPRSAVSEIDPDRTLIIGDFGPGSDAPIALDYRKNTSEPSVIRLKWAEKGNHWVQLSPSFAAFATSFGK